MTNKNQFTSIDLCCGGGGASLGAEQAGFTSVLAIDHNKNAKDCYKENFPNAIVLCKKMEEVKGNEILQLTRLKSGELDHLHCSWPCVEYSSANTNTAKQPPININRTFSQFVDKIRELQPKTFTGENVDGM